MDFTPIAPTQLDGSVKNELLVLAEEIVIKSAKIEGSHNKIILTSIKNMLRNVNSYYSNQIESEGTHPVDIEKAMRKEYSSNEKKKRLQMLSIAHIKVQEEIENDVNLDINPITKEYIKKVHNLFYSKEAMDSFCKIELKNKNGEIIRYVDMLPGEIRTTDVEVGKHLAPKYEDVDYLLNMFETLYKLPKYKTKSEKLIYALSSHHRLVWIHPFLDGNGRVSRLILDSFLHYIGLEGYGLWNISRGLSRNIKQYQIALSNADEIKFSQTDGRGFLSNKMLEEFVIFMLKTSLDQIEYMQNCLKLDNLANRIDNYCKKANASFLGISSLPEGSENIFKALLIHGEIERGKVQDLIGKKKTVTASVIKELIDRYYLVSDGPKKPLRLNFNAHFASQIFPELMPIIE